jgi:hypothetical protein
LRPGRSIAGAEAGKHVLCEKLLGRSAEESYEIWRRVAAAAFRARDLAFLDPVAAVVPGAELVLDLEHELLAARVGTRP